MRSKHAQLNSDGSRLQRVRVCTRLKAAAEIRVTSERGRASSQPCWVRGGELMLQLFQARSGSVNSMMPVSSARPTSLRLKFKSAHSQLLSNHLKLNTSASADVPQEWRSTAENVTELIFVRRLVRGTKTTSNNLTKALWAHSGRWWSLWRSIQNECVCTLTVRTPDTGMDLLWVCSTASAAFLE